ncbi:MAG TPA: HD domain-containing phosphohydrolase [Deinococcales bacterium]|nr:HD domain-containing phosphohydrolase [Deinococcales bacterium]
MRLLVPNEEEPGDPDAALLDELGRERERSARLERRLARLEALRALDRALVETLDARLTLNVILGHAVAHLRADAAVVTLLDPASGTLSLLACTGFRTAAPESLRVALGQGVNGRVAAARDTLEVPDLTTAPLCPEARSWLVDAERMRSVVAAPLVARGKVLGTLSILRREPLNLDEGWREFFEALSAQAAVAMDNAQLVESLERTNADLSRAYDKTIEGWARALDLRDEETEGHSRRVTEMTVELARAVGMSEAEIMHVRRGALLHDMGKLGVPDAILRKPGPLTPEEWTVMKRHPGLAVEMLEPIEFLRPALDIPRAHHERWDGGGYPHGLAGEAIPLAARLFAPVDVFDALTNDRPYRRAWTVERTLEHIRAGAGTHFDPDALRVFLRVFGG